MTTSRCHTYTRPVLVGINTNKAERYIFQPPCKMWSCPYCATTNKLQWAERVKQGILKYKAEGLEDWSFITITMSEKTRGFVYSVSKWPGGWARLSARMRRKYPGIRYVLLPELHKDDTLHTHALCTPAVGNTWLSQNAHLSGLGRVSKSKDLYNSDKGRWYVIKYLDKSLGVVEWPKNFRRIRTSQKWPLLTDDDEFTRLDVEWSYLATYPNDGLDYLAEGLLAKTGYVHKVL